MEKKATAGKLWLGAIILLISGMAAVSENASAVLITQVLYDPVNTETGGEAVELFNPGNSSVDISLWTLATEASAADATIPNNTVLGPGQHFLIADAGWNASKDNPSWRNADYEEAMTLANTDSGVALMNRTAIDAVGWGNAASIDAGLWEGIPAQDVAEGDALVRKKNASYQDTGDNQADFVGAAPDFSAAAGSSIVQAVTLNATILSAVPSIRRVEVLTDDAGGPGSQVLPVPKSNRAVTVRVEASDGNSHQDLESVTVLFENQSFPLSRTTEVNSTNALYEGSFNVPYYTLPGVHGIDARTRDYAGGAASANASFEVLPLLAIELENSTLEFSVSPGSYSESSAAVYNIGNTLLDVEVSGTNLTSGQGRIGVSSVEYSFPGKPLAPLSYGKAISDINLQPGEGSFQAMTVRLNAPAGAPVGNYIGSILVSGVSG